MNKKFLAGATLAAFATTLVPAAAFADVKLSQSGAFPGDDSVANVTYQDKDVKDTPWVYDYADVYVDLKDGGFEQNVTTQVYVWAEVDGKITDGVDFHTKSGDKYTELAGGKFAEVATEDIKNGSVQLFLNSKDAFGGENVTIKAGFSNLAADQTPAKVSDIDQFNYTTDVKFKSVNQGEEYTVALKGDDITDLGNGKYDYTAKVGTTGINDDVIELVVEAQDAPTGTEVEIVVDKDGLAATQDSYELNSRKVATVKLLADKADDYTVYVTVGETEVELTVDVTADASTIKLAAAEEKVVATKKAASVAVEVFDINGDAVPTVDTEVAKLFEGEILSAPEDSSLEGEVITLKANDDKNKALFTFTPDVEGEYVIKMRNASTGKGFTTTVEAAKMGDVVKMELKYDSTTVALGSTIVKPEVVKYDANGVSVKDDANVVFSANGKGFGGFNGSEGAFKVSTDDKYAGESFTVSAIDTKNAVTATVEFKIAGEAQGIELINSEAQVGKDAKLSLSVVDENGNKIVLAGAPQDPTIVVLEKPEDAKVVANIGNEADLAETGVATLDFIANVEGTYKLQVMIPVITGQDANSKDIYEYHTGVVEVTVGEKEVEASGIVTMFINSANYMINGEAAAMDVAPFIQDGRTFLPVRTVAEAVGAEVAYDEATQVATFTKGKDVVTLTLGSNIMTVNGEAVTMDAAAFSKDGRTVAPLRFVAEAFGCDVEAITAVDGTTSGVILTLK